MLQELTPDLWVTERPLRVAGIEVGTRMTVIRLRDGSLFLHSPVTLDADLRKELDALGPVRFVVAPNRFHHLFVGEYAASYPDVRLYAAPGLEAKRRDVAWEGVLGDEAPPEWADEIDQRWMRGFPLANEVVFLHRASRTLVAADLAFHVGPEAPRATRIALRMGGAYGRLTPSALERVLIRDRAANRESLRSVLAWDFDRVIVSHGTVVESGGREALAAGYRWLLEPPTEPRAARLYFIPRSVKPVQDALVRLFRHYFERAPGWVLLTTRGRKTGLPREVLLPCERTSDSVLVISTYGWRSQWIKNLRADPSVEISCGGWRLAGRAEVVEEVERKRALVAQHPFCPAAPFAWVHAIFRTLLRPLLVLGLKRWVTPRPVVVIHREPEGGFTAKSPGTVGSTVG